MFNVGDIIRLKENFGDLAAVKGAEAIVIESRNLYYSGEEMVDVNWIRDGKSKGQRDGKYYKRYFEIVETEWDTEVN